MTDTDQTSPKLTERELAAWARQHLSTVAATMNPGYTTRAIDVVLGQNLALTSWIRENRGRLHRPTCLDGNGCRCGLGDLPMWGGADVPELPEGGEPQGDAL